MDGFGGGRGFFGSLGNDLDNLFGAFHDDFFRAFEENMRNFDSLLQAELPRDLV